jgi:hypothetical protein
MDRLNVTNILRRKKYRLQDDNYSCMLCPNNREETTFHLFFTCPFSRDCWNHLNINWRLDLDMMDRAKQQSNTTFFMEISMVGAWIIWKQRNDCIFNWGYPSLQS